MYEEMKARTRRFYEEVLNGRRLEVFDETHAADLVVHDPGVPGGEIRGRDAYKQFIGMMSRALPDYHFTVYQVLAEGEYTVARWTATGTHNGDYLGIAPTGAQVTLAGVSISRHEGGKVVESWVQMDNLGLLRQIGVVKVPEPTAASS
jgi:predicted ester cyclase